MKIIVIILLVFIFGCCPKCDERNTVTGVIEKVEFQKSGFGSAGLTIVTFQDERVMSFRGDSGDFVIGKKTIIKYDGFKFIKNIEVVE